MFLGPTSIMAQYMEPLGSTIARALSLQESLSIALAIHVFVPLMRILFVTVTGWGPIAKASPPPSGPTATKKALIGFVRSLEKWDQELGAPISFVWVAVTAGLAEDPAQGVPDTELFSN